MRPLIVVTTTLEPDHRQLPQARLGAQYITAIEEPGGSALLLTPAHDAESIPRLLGLADGLLLTGGEDIAPAHYGQAPHPAAAAPNPLRDAMELATLAHALERGVPVLAICRGMQLLNVALGGTLYQDLPSQRPGPLQHEQSLAVNQRSHWASVAAGSRLHGIFGVERLFINSFHHQGVDRLAGPLRAVVWAEDGLVEGVEARDGRWIVGVQWHPERGEAAAPGDPRHPDRRLFWDFLAAARARRARRSEDDELLDLVQPEAPLVAGDRGGEQHLRGAFRADGAR